MKITLFFTLFFLNVQLVHSACPVTISYRGYDPINQNYSPPINIVVGGSVYDCDLILCPGFSQIEIKFPQVMSVTWSDGTTNTTKTVDANQTITATFNAGCNIYSTTFHVIPSDFQLSTPLSVYLSACAENSFEFICTGGTGNYLYNYISNMWYGFPDTTNVMLTYISNDTLQSYNNPIFTVNVRDGSCFLSNDIQIYPSIVTEAINTQICMVTIDSSNSHNLITWEKNPNMGIVTYRIYKQSTLTSQYELIHEQPYASLSEFVDLNSNANQEISRYKILAADSCGYESTISPNHTTILLSSNLGASSVNLSWNPYEGFTYPNFEIWRSLNGGVSYNLLASVANNTYAYIDNNAPQQAYYQVRINNEAGCFSSKSQYNNVVSNTVDQSGNSLSLSEYSSNLPLTAYPNPTNDFFNLKSNKNLIGSKYEILDNLGRVILSSLISEENLTIDLENASSGIYNLVIYGENVESIKLIKK
jgi:hypothetical protein